MPYKKKSDYNRFMREYLRKQRKEQRQQLKQIEQLKIKHPNIYEEFFGKKRRKI